MEENKKYKFKGILGVRAIEPIEISAA